jgi:hypothetical protein
MAAWWQTLVAAIGGVVGEARCRWLQWRYCVSHDRREGPKPPRCGSKVARRPLPPARRECSTVCATPVLPAGLLLFLAPMKAVLRARSERVLGVSEGEGQAGCARRVCRSSVQAPLWAPALPALTPAPSTVCPLRRT